MMPDGGAEIRAVAKDSGQFYFQVRYCSKTKQSELSSDQLKYFREREQQCCQDVKKVHRELVRHGFNYEIEGERNVPEDRIGIVVVEDIQELRDQAQFSNSQSTYSQPKQKEK
jgi:hypothetical protein